MATIYIDDQPYEMKEGSNILQAALEAGLDLPYFCWHPEMGSVGACRQCAIVQYRDEEDTRGRIVMGCMTAVSDGARFSMKGEDASEFRENIVESLMLNHPHDCPVCAEGGECHLQDMTVMVGHRDRRYRGKKNTHNNQYLGPLINHEMNRCISCYRCTRFYNDYAGGRDLAAHAAHDHVYFGRHEDGVLESEFAGNLVEVCPTGVFTDKPLVNSYTRKWDLQSAPSVCTGCSLGCNTLAGERYGELKRVHNRYNNEVNGYFLCDRGRYGSSYVNDEARLKFAGLRAENGQYNAITASDAITTLASWCSGNTVAGIGSPRASLETNHLLRSLVGNSNFCGGASDQDAALNTQIASILKNGSASTPSLKQIESADAILVLGEDITNTAPRMALSLRQSVRNKAKAMAAELRIPSWQDEAVRNLAQDQKSPLYIVAVNNTPLDDIAEQCIHMSSADIAELGFAIAGKLNGDSSTNTSHDSLSRIAEDLSNSSNPLIVSGTGCNSIAVIQAASAIAEALKAKDNTDQNVMLSYCFSEVNSLGSALHNEAGSCSLGALVERAENGEIDTLIVAENDLYRRAPQSQVDSLFDNVKRLVVLDCLDSATMSRSDLALPAGTPIESEGTVVNNEGRAQRHYPVFLASDDRSPSWQWLTKLGQQLARNSEQESAFSSIKTFQDVELACEAANPALTGMSKASPNAEYRNKGLKIPRQTHRSSGRTAMQADISVHEPKQPEDTESPLAFTMEGKNGAQPGSLLPFVWAPGWNSNQSLHKFQDDIGGPLKGGTAGERLINAAATSTLNFSNSKAGKKSDKAITLEACYKIFGSDEMSVRCKPIQELSQSAYIQLNPEQANSMELHDGGNAQVSQGGSEFNYQVIVSNSIPDGCATFSVGLNGGGFLVAGEEAQITPAPHTPDSTIVVENGSKEAS